MITYGAFGVTVLLLSFIVLLLPQKGKRLDLIVFAIALACNVGLYFCGVYNLPLGG